MPDMFEIYQNHADRYHELVIAEDFQNNLGSLLSTLVDWDDLSVFEAGVGTGRVTQLYIDAVAAAVCCDRSQHMLDFAQRLLDDHSSKLTFRLTDNTNFPDFGRSFDLFIEGWSFGHSIMACADKAEVLKMANLLLTNARKNLAHGSPLIIIETMGTNTDEPAPPQDKLAFFYDSLSEKHDFTPHVIQTDYRFKTNKEAAEVMGFFFGDKMKQSIVDRGTTIIPEWTGVWIKRV